MHISGLHLRIASQAFLTIFGLYVKKKTCSHVKPSQTLTKSLGLGSDEWINSLLNHESTNYLKIDDEGEMNYCGLDLAEILWHQIFAPSLFQL